jgi:hypothetical protein
VVCGGARVDLAVLVLRVRGVFSEVIIKKSHLEICQSPKGLIYLGMLYIHMACYILVGYFKNI